MGVESREIVMDSSWEELRANENTPDSILEHFIVFSFDDTQVTHTGRS